MKVIDAHTHVLPQHAGLAVEVMDICGIDRIITLEWHDGFAETLKKHLEVFNSYGNRFVVFGNVDWSRINEKNFGETAARQMEEDAAAGMRGLKIYKALGLEYRRASGELWRISDPELDPIWAKAGELGIPLLIHCADPAAFWQPVNENNFWNGVLYGEYEWWAYYGKDYPSRKGLLADRNDMIARHPKTTFICPHMGSNADCLDSAASDLDDFSNLYYDFSARVPILGMSEKSAAHTRKFMIKYQERILFGTDAIYDDTSVPTGVQAQCLCQPGEIPPVEGNPKKKYVETTVEFFRSHIDFLTTDELQTKPPFRRKRDGFTITGIKLPSEECEKILYENVSKLVPGL